MSIKYNTAVAMSTLAKFYAKGHITLIADDGGPRTDGKVIYLPSLPMEVTEEELNDIRCYLDHEAGHIVAKSFVGGAMQVMDSKWGNQGCMILNALEDARIETHMDKEFKGVNFSGIHEKFKSQPLGTFTQQLVHVLYMNSRFGWGHHPDCAAVEDMLEPLKNSIMKVHGYASVSSVKTLADKVAALLQSTPPPLVESEEGEEEKGEGEGKGKAEAEAEGEGEGQGEGQGQGQGESRR
jgi:hypothetical protein